MSRELPILFNGPMVRALLRDANGPQIPKTQTRRLVTPEPASGMRWQPVVLNGYGSGYVDGQGSPRPARYDVGDVLYVRETWGLHPHGDVTADWCRQSIRGRSGDDVRAEWAVAYGADQRWIGDYWEHWRPSIHMPRWAARVWLRVTDVRAEQVQDMPMLDAYAEGLTELSKDGGRTFKWGIADRDGWPGTDNDGWPWQDWQLSARDAYARLWDQVAPEDAKWSDNPWVFVYTFERVRP